MMRNRTLVCVPRRLALALFGLLASATGCLNPDLVNQAVGSFYPTAPGNTPFLMIQVVNQSQARLDVPIAYDNGVTTPVFYIRNLNPLSHDTGVVLPWPVLRLAIGDLTNPLAPTISATYPNGAVQAVPFGHAALQAGVDYQRGDTIIFVVTGNAQSPAYLNVSIGRIDGAADAGATQRADPFGITELLLLQNGFITAIPLGG
ncbi:MAG: hypothetical protein ACPMAQ_05750 [Phycisphaerae bacterium]